MSQSPKPLDVRAQVTQRTVLELVTIYRIGDQISIRGYEQFLPRGAQIVGTAFRDHGKLEVICYGSDASDPGFVRVVDMLSQCVATGLPLATAVCWAVDEETYAVMSGSKEAAHAKESPPKDHLPHRVYR